MYYYTMDIFDSLCWGHGMYALEPYCIYKSANIIYLRQACNIRNYA